MAQLQPLLAIALIAVAVAAFLFTLRQTATIAARKKSALAVRRELRAEYRASVDDLLTALPKRSEMLRMKVTEDGFDADLEALSKTHAMLEHWFFAQQHFMSRGGRSTLASSVSGIGQDIAELNRLLRLKSENEKKLFESEISAAIKCVWLSARGRLMDCRAAVEASITSSDARRYRFQR